MDKTGGFALADLLPGPLNNATRQQKMDTTNQLVVAGNQGWNVQLWAQWQQEYGDRGLGTNIVIPNLDGALGGEVGLNLAVVVADPEDSERMARMHTRKQSNFEPVLFDSIISTQDNEYWMEQRKHLSEVFLPISSLAEILPVSLARAKKCA